MVSTNAASGSEEGDEDWLWEEKEKEKEMEMGKGKGKEMGKVCGCVVYCCGRGYDWLS